jgi:superfamily I DNA/RNA helicase
MTSFSPTPEQQAIFSTFATSTADVIIDAKAGAGKTSTVIAGLQHLSGTSLLMAFNKAIAEEIKRKVGDDLPFHLKAMVQVSTVHAHGLSALKAGGHKQAQVQGGKLAFLCKDMLRDRRDSDPAHLNARHIRSLTSMAKNSGFGLTACDGREQFPAFNSRGSWHQLIEHFNLDTELEGDYSADDLVDDALELLQLSNRKLGMIDFDDMVYLPLLLSLPLRLYDNVLIDEAQDINATRRELAFRSRKPGGRLIAVGDPHQAIYGFTGASVDSLDRIRQRSTNSVTLPLSICWRCADAILVEARKIVPGIQTAPSKVGKGTVRKMAFRQEALPAAGHQREPLPAQDFLAAPAPGDAILCRLNKPNVAVALGLLRRGTPAKIEGRDLGNKLLDHVKRADDLYAHHPLVEQIDGLEHYREQEAMRLANKKREAAAELLKDEVDAAILLIERCLETVGPKAGFNDLDALVKSLFGDDVSSRQVVTLASIHKAKGREWPRVYLLGYHDYQPFWKAEEGWQLEQEYNLMYVAWTRAEEEAIIVLGAQSAINKGLHRLAPLQAQVA